jgi:hypothetical protein
METFAISVGVDPNELKVQKTEDGFGAFKTREDAARRLIEMADGRIYELRRSKARAKRILRAAVKSSSGSN